MTWSGGDSCDFGRRVAISCAGAARLTCEGRLAPRRLPGHCRCRDGDEMPMPAPVTTLDQQYSDPAATAASWEETQKVLESAELFWVSTVRADGRPHVTPVVAAWWDGAIWFATGADEQKFANMASNPNVVMTTGCNHWDQGLDVVVEGEAIRVTNDG